MKRYALCALAVFSLPALVLAAPETYLIDGTHTYPMFEYNHLGFSMQTHRFTRTSGTITLDRIARTGSAQVVIDARSVDTGSGLFDKHIQGEDFFDTAHFPSITFNSSRMQFEGDKLVAIEGELTIKGVTRPIVLEVKSMQCKPHPLRQKDACGANAIAHVRRSEFNMSKNVPYVSDEVTLSIPVEAIKE